MSEEPEPEARPRVSVTPFLEALEYDAAIYLHRGQTPMQTDAAQTQQDTDNGSESDPALSATPKVRPWSHYLQALGTRLSMAGAGLGLFLAGCSLLLLWIIGVVKGLDIYIDCQPKPIITSDTMRTPPKVFVPIGNLPHADDLSSEEEAMTAGKPLPPYWQWWVLFHLTLFPLAIYGCIRGANACIKKAEETEIGVPLTSANTGHLPAVESLVRASQKSAQDAQATLLRSAHPQTLPEQMLRPATYSEEKQVEQLVRPAGGQE